jgi:hypothetical protein
MQSGDLAFQLSVGRAGGAGGSTNADCARRAGTSSPLRMGRAMSAGSYTDCASGDAALRGEAKTTEVIEPDALKQTAASDEIRRNLLQHRAGLVNESSSTSFNSSAPRF